MIKKLKLIGNSGLLLGAASNTRREFARQKRSCWFRKNVDAGNAMIDCDAKQSVLSEKVQMK